MKPTIAHEKIKLWRIPHLVNLELLLATYLTQTFSRHSHEGFAIGVIERGALGFSYRGAKHVAPPGVINLANPGEAHNGYAASDLGWTYRMFYLDPVLLQQAASEVLGRTKDIPFFQAGVIQDSYLAGLIRHLHIILEKSEAPVLEQESRLLYLLTQLVIRYADDRFRLRPVGKENQSVKKIRDYIETHYAEEISLKQLVLIANLSPFHLIRVFRNEVGIPPHAYLTQVRVNRARALLAEGWPGALVAHETGFVDQSHLTRQFKRIMGFTPGQYSKSIQDLSV